MTLKTCLRCDWQGETKESGCPNCGERSLYLVGAPPSGEAGRPPGISFPQSDPSTPSTDAVGSSGRSARAALPFVLAASVLIVALGTLLKAHEERSAPAASSDALVQETRANGGSPPPPVEGTGSIKTAQVVRNAPTAEGAPLPVSWAARGWGRFARIS